MTLKNGDKIWVTANGRRMEGSVMIISENQKALFAEFDGGLWVGGGMAAGSAPLELADDGFYYMLGDHTVPVKVEPRE